MDVYVVLYIDTVPDQPSPIPDTCTVGYMCGGTTGSPYGEMHVGNSNLEFP